MQGRASVKRAPFSCSWYDLRLHTMRPHPFNAAVVVVVAGGGCASGLCLDLFHAVELSAFYLSFGRDSTVGRRQGIEHRWRSECETDTMRIAAYTILAMMGLGHAACPNNVSHTFIGRPYFMRGEKFNFMSHERRLTIVWECALLSAPRWLPKTKHTSYGNCRLIIQK